MPESGLATPHAAEYRWPPKARCVTEVAAHCTKSTRRALFSKSRGSRGWEVRAAPDGQVSGGSGGGGGGGRKVWVCLNLAAPLPPRHTCAARAAEGWRHVPCRGQHLPPPAPVSDITLLIIATRLLPRICPGITSDVPKVGHTGTFSCTPSNGAASFLERQEQPEKLRHILSYKYLLCMCKVSLVRKGKKTEGSGEAGDVLQAAQQSQPAVAPGPECGQWHVKCWPQQGLGAGSWPLAVTRRRGRGRPGSAVGPVNSGCAALSAAHPPPPTRAPPPRQRPRAGAPARDTTAAVSHDGARPAARCRRPTDTAPCATLTGSRKTDKSSSTAAVWGAPSASAGRSAVARGAIAATIDGLAVGDTACADTVTAAPLP
ncbi:uncharacterized protein LOC126263278 [Schistocerca nitens]|uniref:uncharacterized protein LOC126263278 n=1 Tax=Schistocerca nitens TaxID=7011 RepID=UPI002117B43A|nr:uncharacterized protein LOC126263278 [Schistocerca nitens]